MKMEQTECSETSAYKFQTPGNYPEENIQGVATFLLNTLRTGDENLRFNTVELGTSASSP